MNEVQMKSARDLAKEINESISNEKGAGHAGEVLTQYVEEFGVTDTLIELCKIYTGVIFDKKFQEAVRRKGGSKKLVMAMAREFGNSMPIRL